MNLKSIKVPVGLVDVANNENWTRSLAYWLIAKNSFRNGSIYNFTFRKLASILNISHTTAKYHFDVWKTNGLVRLLGNGTLVFCGLEEMEVVAMRNYDNEKSCTKHIRINMFSSIREQVMVLQCRIIQKNINQQARNIVRSREVLKNVGVASKKMYLTSDEKKAYFKSLSIKKQLNLKSADAVLRLSNSKIAELVGCSLSYAKSLKYFMNLAGILSTQKVKGEILTSKRISLKEFTMRKEYSSEFDEAFFHKGHAYSYPKSTYSIGYAVKSSWISLLLGESI